jgi:hypothetical protein
MRKELKELLEKWKEGYGIAIEVKKYSPEELNEFHKEMEKMIAGSQRRNTIQYPRRKAIR